MMVVHRRFFPQLLLLLFFYGIIWHISSNENSGGVVAFVPSSTTATVTKSLCRTVPRLMIRTFNKRSHAALEEELEEEGGQQKDDTRRRTTETTTTTSTTTKTPPPTLNSKQPYLRWNTNNKSCWKMETAVTTFQRGTSKVELHAQLHFGEPAYFDYFNSNEFANQHDSVHFELLVDDTILQYNNDNNNNKEKDEQQHQQSIPRRRRRQVHQAIMASPNDQILARQYGWVCQVDSIDYTQPNWYHADLTRQEFLQLVAADPKQEQQRSTNNNNNNNNRDTTPLWKLTSSSPQSYSAAAEAISALMVGPPTLSFSTTQGFLKRRLFTNLFLPGDALANNLRALLWFTVPCPELSIILLDWSSLLQTTTGKGNLGGGNGGSSLNSNKNPGSALSEVAVPILSSLLRLNLQQVRQFLFGQVLVSSSAPTMMSNNNNNNQNTDQSWSLLVTKRNDHALQVLEHYLEEQQNQQQSSSSTALLYGSSHCPDLHAKLQSMGFTPTKTVWRTAWTVDQGNESGSSSWSTTDINNDDNKNDNNIQSILPGLVTLVLAYLVVGALDWVGMMGDVSQAWVEQGDYIDGLLLAGFYLIRHALLYLGLSKFLIDWDTTSK